MYIAGKVVTMDFSEENFRWNGFNEAYNQMVQPHKNFRPGSVQLAAMVAVKEKVQENRCC
jgi:hypothetical protein